MLNAFYREFVLPADPATVWQRSIGSPGALSSWFPERIEGEFEVGGRFFLVWGDTRCEARLIESVPNVSLAYQWHPGESCSLDARPEEELTTVWFSLTPTADGRTTLRLVESGFDRIPGPQQAHAVEMNTSDDGWDGELAKLVHQWSL